MTSRKPLSAAGTGEVITPLSSAARAFLRSVRVAGGRIALYQDRMVRAQECRRAGYLHIRADGKVSYLTGLGQAYLDRLMRAH